MTAVADRLETIDPGLANLDQDRLRLWIYGFQASRRLGDGPLGTMVEFSLGRRLTDGRGILYYKVQRVLPDAPVESITLLLYYDAPAGS